MDGSDERRGRQQAKGNSHSIAPIKKADPSVRGVHPEERKQRRAPRDDAVERSQPPGLTTSDIATYDPIARIARVGGTRILIREACYDVVELAASPRASDYRRARHRASSGMRQRRRQQLSRELTEFCEHAPGRVCGDREMDASSRSADQRTEW